METNGPLYWFTQIYVILLEVLSVSGRKFIVNFIDDYSGKELVYILKEIVEACDIFKSFKAYIQKQSGFNIKSPRIDRGAEY